MIHARRFEDVDPAILVAMHAGGGEAAAPPLGGWRVIQARSAGTSIFTASCPHWIASWDAHPASDAEAEADLATLDDCPVVEVWFCVSPATAAPKALGREYAETIKRFLRRYAPCPCVPDLRMALKAPFPTDRATLHLEHDRGCPGLAARASR